MTPQEYAERVAAEMGWVWDNVLRHYVFITDGKMCGSVTDWKLDPSQDWASAGVWIEWLTKARLPQLSVEFAENLFNSECLCRIWVAVHGNYEGKGKTLLLALQAASEAYFDAKGEKQ